MSRKERIMAAIRKVQPGPTAPAQSAEQKQMEYRERIDRAHRRYRKQ